MGIPVVSIPWYSAVIAAKRLSPHYFDLMDRLGYHDGLPRYGSLPFMTTLENDPSRAPYGGLPKPMLLLDRLRGDYVQRVAEQWARAFGVPNFVLDCSAATTLGPDWAEPQSARLGGAVPDAPARLSGRRSCKSLIRVAETLSHRVFDHVEFTRQMHRVNEAGELVAEIRDIIARTVPAPVPLTEQLTNVMAATWHRGSQWSVDHLRAYRDEVRSARRTGIGACAGRAGPAALAEQRALVQHRLLSRLRGEIRRGVRLVDVHELPLGRLSQVFHRRSAARAGGAAHQHERAAASAAVDGGMDHHAGPRFRRARRGDAGADRRPDVRLRHALRANSRWSAPASRCWSCTPAWSMRGCGTRRK